MNRYFCVKLTDGQHHHLFAVELKTVNGKPIARLHDTGGGAKDFNDGQIASCTLMLDQGEIGRVSCTAAATSATTATTVDELRKLVGDTIRALVANMTRAEQLMMYQHLNALGISLRGPAGYIHYEIEDELRAEIKRNTEGK